MKRTPEWHLSCVVRFCISMLFVNHASALELNTASEADLDGLKGIGPATSRRMLEARAHAPFQDWADVRQRVKGLGPKLLHSLAEQGVTANGQAWAHDTPPPANSARSQSTTRP